MKTKPQPDAFADLCELLREAGATMTLYGKPVTEAEVRAYAAGRVDERTEIEPKLRRLRRR